MNNPGSFHLYSLCVKFSLMKNLLLTILALSSTLVFSSSREIQLHTEKVGDVMHWMPAKIEVTPGETVRIVAKHDLEGGFDFHGLNIPVLKVQAKVDRHKPFTQEVTIPKTLKPGDYEITCHFHPAHAGAILNVVVTAPKK